MGDTDADSKKAMTRHHSGASGQLAHTQSANQHNSIQVTQEQAQIHAQTSDTRVKSARENVPKSAGTSHCALMVPTKTHAVTVLQKAVR